MKIIVKFRIECVDEKGMIESFQRAIRIRALCIFLTLHTGLAFCIYAIARVSANFGMDSTLWVMTLGAALLYFSTVLAVFFIIWPMWPWIKRARQVKHWTDRFREELPIILDLIKQLAALWNEVSKISGSRSASPARAPSDQP